MFAAHTHCVSTRAAFGATPRHGSTSRTHSRVLGFAKPNRRGPATKGRNAAYPSITASASSNDDARITVIGEALWDSLPKGLFLGGAPANVACHLRELGRSPTVVSRVGDDELGREVLRRLTKRGLSTDLIQVDTTNTPTGFVVVTMDGSMPSYDIVQPSAWDAMEPTEQLVTAATGAVVVYGSLAQRDARSRAAIGAAAAVASKRVFDINLRPPFIDPAMCVEHAKQCWLLKLNDDELPEMYNWCGLDGLDGSDPAQVIAMACAVRDALECDNLCVTRGGDGALLVASSGAVAQHPGFDVTAVDTVGAGDSFLATLLDSLLGGATASASLERACRVGAFVATQQGATPMHDRDAIEGLVSK